MQGPDQWTHQASLLAVQNFPNLQSLKLSGCAIPLPALRSLLQRSLPQGIHLSKSQLCSRAAKDSGWLMQLMGCEGLRYLAVHGTFNGMPVALRAPKEPHLSATLTHLILDVPGIGDVQNWLDVVVHLPALEHFEASCERVISTIPQVGLSATLQCGCVS
jgi:hypothetical protein